MRNYQPNSKYKIPHNVYMQVQYKLKDYQRLQNEMNTMLYSFSPPGDGMPKGNYAGDPTGTKAARLVQIRQEIAAVDEAAAIIRGKYSDRVNPDFDPVEAYWDYGYFNYMYHRSRSPDDLGPCLRTWKYFKSRFSKEIAKKLNLL